MTTLELDTAITKDGQVLVTHEPRILPLHCQDTRGNHFVGQLVKDLTLAQAQTLDCGTRHAAAPGDPLAATQESVPGTRMPTLDEVFDLAERCGARDIQFNIETKIDRRRPTTRSTRSRSPGRSSTSSARTTRSTAACCSPSTGARS